MCKTALFDGALRFTPFWLFLDVLLLLHFALSWGHSFWKTGWKIDFFYLTLFQWFIVPLLLIYPFNASFHNAYTLGMNPFLQADPYIDQAFAITLLGYVGVWMGTYLVSVAEVRGLCERLFSPFRPLEELIIKNTHSRRSIYLLFFLCIGVTLSITLLSAFDGFFLRPRAFFQQNGSLRPLYNFATTVAPLFLTSLSLYFLHTKERWAKWLLLTTFPFTIFFGIRAVLIQSLLFYYTFSIFKNRGRFKMIRFTLVVFFLIFLGLELEKVREGIPFSSELWAPLAYGSHFSDTRDFAWILANWEGDYLYGMGYLANLLSFIPSDFLEFRQQYSLANYTSSLIGLDLGFHNGVRSGFFGQVFFNFSYLGVFLSGILLGITLKFTDQKFKKCIVERGDIVEAYGRTIPSLCLTGILFSNIYWLLYLFILVHLLQGALRRVRRCPQNG